MKSFEEFFKTLDVKFFHDIEVELKSNSFVVNAPTEEIKRHCEITVISSLVLGKYHEWLAEQLS